METKDESTTTTTDMSMATPEKKTPQEIMGNSDEDMNTPNKMASMGGRKKSRKVNPALKSWVKFVKKIQHEEKLTYPEAMKRASKRKSEWQRGGADITDDSDKLDLSKEMKGGRRRRSRKQRGGEGEVIEDDEVDGQQMGGRRRRSRKQRGGEGETSVEDDDEVDGEIKMMGGRRRRRRSRSRKQRGGNVADFDSDWKQYGKVGGRRRTRRHRR